MDVLNESDELLQQAQEAKDEATKACSLDNERSYYEAIQHYDQAVSIVDEILSSIPENTALWERILVCRQRYSDRMVSMMFK